MDPGECSSGDDGAAEAEKHDSGVPEGMRKGQCASVPHRGLRLRYRQPRDSRGSRMSAFATTPGWSRSGEGKNRVEFQNINNNLGNNNSTVKTPQHDASFVNYKSAATSLLATTFCTISFPLQTKVSASFVYFFFFFLFLFLFFSSMAIYYIYLIFLFIFFCFLMGNGYRVITIICLFCIPMCQRQTRQ